MQINCKQVVLDGELIVPDEEGKPSFHNIMSWDRIKDMSVLNSI